VVTLLDRLLWRLAHAAILAGLLLATLLAAATGAVLALWLGVPGPAPGPRRRDGRHAAPGRAGRVGAAGRAVTGPVQFGLGRGQLGRVGISGDRRFRLAESILRQ
jgi:hypothetical protein